MPLFIETAAIFYFFVYLSMQSYFHAASVFIVGTTIAFGIYLLRKPHLYYWAANLSVTVGFFHLFNIVLSTGGTESPFLVWLLLISMGAAFFGTSLSFLLWTIIVCAAYAIVSWLPFTGFTHPYPLSLPASSEAFLLATSNIWVVLISSLWFYFNGKAVFKSFEEVLKSREQISNLVRILGHDIAGPSTVIQNYTQMLIDEDEMPVKQKDKALHTILRNADAINSLINKVRELQAIESGKKELSLVRVDVAKVMRLAADLLREKYEQKRVRLNVELPADNMYINAEPDILAFQVIPNLLSNALKFSEDGHQVTLKAINENQKIKFIVEDQGVGIPKTLLENIFSYEKKTTRTGTSGEKGTGFGMPLVRGLVEKMKGEIAIESRAKEEFPQNHGTQISISFPLN